MSTVLDSTVMIQQNAGGHDYVRKIAQSPSKEEQAGEYFR